MFFCLSERIFLLMNTATYDSTIRFSITQYLFWSPFFSIIIAREVLEKADLSQKARSGMNHIGFKPFSWLRNDPRSQCYLSFLPLVKIKGMIVSKGHIYPYHWRTSINNVIPVKPPQSLKGGHISSSSIPVISYLFVQLNTWIASFFYCFSTKTIANVVEQILNTS